MHTIEIAYCYDAAFETVRDIVEMPEYSHALSVRPSAAPAA
jgi:hypothetical protein